MGNNKKVWFEVPTKSIIKKTEKAVLIAFGGPEIYESRFIPEENKCWLPLSQISMEDENNGKTKITIPMWQIEKGKGIILDYVQIFNE